MAKEEEFLEHLKIQVYVLNYRCSRVTSWLRLTRPVMERRLLEGYENFGILIDTDYLMNNDMGPISISLYHIC